MNNDKLIETVESAIRVGELNIIELGRVMLGWWYCAIFLKHFCGHQPFRAIILLAGYNKDTKYRGFKSYYIKNQLFLTEA